MPTNSYKKNQEMKEHGIQRKNSLVQFICVPSLTLGLYSFVSDVVVDGFCLVIVKVVYSALLLVCMHAFHLRAGLTTCTSVQNETTE